MNPWEFAQSIGLPEILVTIVSLVVTWMLTQLSNYISNKSEEVKNKTDNDSMKRYIEIATSTVTGVVDYLNHSVVNDLKIAASDGKLTQEEVDQIKATARVQVQSILSAEAIQALQQVYGDINALIDTWIVNAVAKAHGAVVIEDAAEAFGATYKGIGAGALADVGCISFNGNKIITGSTCGIMLSDNKECVEKAR